MCSKRNHHHQLLAFRLSLDSKEINSLHLEAVLLLSSALRARGASLQAGHEAIRRLQFYFTNDSIHMEESLRMEAELLVDIKELLSHWDRVNLEIPAQLMEMQAGDVKVGRLTLDNPTFTQFSPTISGILTQI
jgi:hypothetical protein